MPCARPACAGSSCSVFEMNGMTAAKAYQSAARKISHTSASATMPIRQRLMRARSGAAIKSQFMLPPELALRPLLRRGLDARRTAADRNNSHADEIRQPAQWGVIPPSGGLQACARLSLNGPTSVSRVEDDFDEQARHAQRQSASRRIPRDRKSTRLNSSHHVISYAVF